MNPASETFTPGPVTVLLASIAAGAIIAAALLWLVYVGVPTNSGGTNLKWLPTFNATCNTLSAGCLIAGYRAIRSHNVARHRVFMLTALAFSTLFLGGYVTHHAVHGDTVFPGIGLIRMGYLTILASHVLLSVIVLPLVLSTLFFALRARFADHRRFARVTLPMWLYVSVTGVLVYLLLRAYA